MPENYRVHSELQNYMTAHNMADKSEVNLGGTHDLSTLHKYRSSVSQTLRLQYQ